MFFPTDLVSQSVQIKRSIDMNPFSRTNPHTQKSGEAHSPDGEMKGAHGQGLKNLFGFLVMYHHVCLHACNLIYMLYMDTHTY